MKCIFITMFLLSKMADVTTQTKAEMGDIKITTPRCELMQTTVRNAEEPLVIDGRMTIDVMCAPCDWVFSEQLLYQSHIERIRRVHQRAYKGIRREMGLDK